MLIADSEELIARFIGMFGMLEFDPRFHSKVAGAEGQAHAVEPAPSEAMAFGGMTTSYDPRVQHPQLRYENDVFELEKVRSRPPATHDVKVDQAAPGFTSHAEPKASAAPFDAHQPNVEAAHHLAAVLPATAYEDAPTDSLLAVYHQNNNLDDRDVLNMAADADPLTVVDAVTRQFQQMVTTAQALQTLPDVPTGEAEIEARLTVVPVHAAGQEAPGGAEGPAGPTVETASGDNWSATSMTMSSMLTTGAPILAPLELEGIYVDGVRSGAMPPLGDLLARFKAETATDTDRSTLDTGSNTLTTNALIRNVGELGYVTTVMGNWYETNSIRQFNLHSDVDDIAGFPAGNMLTGGTQAMNVAQFSRVDATPTNAFALPDFGFLPSNYHVDVVEGNLQITSFLSQLNFMMDGDRVVLTSTQNRVGISTGDNDATATADLLKRLGSYDLVIIGGSVFEGNFIQQINVLSDNDRLVSAMTGPGADAVSGSTGGNLLLNAAKITNVGGLGDFAPLTPDMSKLVSTIAGRGTVDDLALGKDLGFLGHSDIRVLYLTGNVYEMNVVSQMNVLDDSDTVLHAGSAARSFVDAAGPGANWSLSTGKNALANIATITDVDDAGFKRFTDGNYYSSSMLVQADLVARSHDIVSFDPGKLAPELVAFVHDDVLPSGFHESMHSILHHDASAEGVGSMLS